MPFLSIDKLALVNLMQGLDDLHRSGFPIAVRTALSSTAFDVKKNTMQESADRNFVKRQPNFFKANSRVDQARGFDVNKMKATIGMVETSLKGAHNYAVKDLEQQEEGGSISKRSFIPLKGGRIGNSFGKNVRANARLSTIKNLIDARKRTGKSDKAKFIAALNKSTKGSMILAKTPNGKTVLWRVNSVSSEVGSRGLKYKLTALYDFEDNRSIKVRGTHFMRSASLKSAEKLESFFIEAANKQMQRLTRK